MKRKPMTHFNCCICGYGSLVKTNFKFDDDHNAYCVKNRHSDRVIKHNPLLENNKNEMP